jgi:hypothetical protein
VATSPAPVVGANVRAVRATAIRPLTKRKRSSCTVCCAPAWERALEEVLLEGVVERFRPGVQTQQIIRIADITEDDCRILDAAMTKCSKWLPGAIRKRRN